MGKVLGFEHQRFLNYLKFKMNAEKLKLGQRKEVNILIS